MELATLLIVVIIACALILLGSLLSHSIKFIFFLLVVFLVMVFIFNISFSEVLQFIQKLVFTYI